MFLDTNWLHIRNFGVNFFIKIKLVRCKYVASCSTEQNERQICWCQPSALNYIVCDVDTDFSAVNIISSELNMVITYQFQFLALIRSCYHKEDTLVRYP